MLTRGMHIPQLQGWRPGSFAAGPAQLPIVPIADIEAGGCMRGAITFSRHCATFSMPAWLGCRPSGSNSCAGIHNLVTPTIFFGTGQDAFHMQGGLMSPSPQDKGTGTYAIDMERKISPGPDRRPAPAS